MDQAELTDSGSLPFLLCRPFLVLNFDLNVILKSSTVDSQRRRFSSSSKKILLAYVCTPRHEGPEVNKQIAEQYAKVLYKAGEKKLGTDEKTFVQIFSERSAAHLSAISSSYHNTYGHSLKKAVKNETSGNFTHALLTIVQCAENPAKYFAKGGVQRVHLLDDSISGILLLELFKRDGIYEAFHYSTMARLYKFLFM